MGLDIKVSKPGEAFWRCVCLCGAGISVRAGNLTNGSTRSCGCLRREFRASAWSKKPSLIIRGGETSRVILCKRNGAFRAVALVDTCDVLLVAGKRWGLNGNGYAVHRTQGGNILSMAFGVLTGGGPRLAPQVDHVNGDTLDNRRINLRWATPRANAMNKTKVWGAVPYKGVSRYGDRYKATITLNRRMRHLGMFNTPEEASEAYNAAAVDLFGEYACLNAV